MEKYTFDHRDEIGKNRKIPGAKTGKKLGIAAMILAGLLLILINAWIWYCIHKKNKR